MTNQNCWQCGKQLYGRSDKKFCDSQCRNHFHNQRHSELNRVSRVVTGHIRSNYHVLNDLIRTGHTQAAFEELALYGFDNHYHTSSFFNDEGQLVRNVYDVQYIILDDSIVKFRRIDQGKVD